MRHTKPCPGAAAHALRLGVYAAVSSILLLLFAHSVYAYGFNLSYQQGFPDDLKPAVLRAAQLWTTWIASVGPGDANTLDLTFGYQPIAGDTLAQAGVSWWHSHNDPTGTHALTPAQYMIQTGSDLTATDGFININSNEQWYPGTDGRPGDKYDTVSMVLHEIGHQLGMLCSYNSFWNRWGVQDNILAPFYLTRWDSLLRDSPNNGQAPVAWPGQSNFNVLSTTPVFVGANAVQTMGRSLNVCGPQSGAFVEGTTLCHLDESSSSLMFRGIYAGESKQGLYDYEVAAFQDLGWLFVTPQAVYANGINGSVWNSGAAWQGGLPPSPQTAVYMTAATEFNYLYHVQRPATVSSLTLSGQAMLSVWDNLTITGDCVNDAQVTLNAPFAANSLFVGESATGALLSQLQGTTSVAVCLEVGYRYGSSGTYRLLEWGTLSAPTQCIGDAGTGKLTQTGGANTATEYLILGCFDSGDGTYELSAGTLQVGQLLVGFYGKGTFSWTGGTLSAQSVQVGARGAMTVGQDWTYGGSLSLSGGAVDMGGRKLEIDNGGALNILNSGQVSNKAGFLGYGSGSSGTATVDGSGSKWTNSGGLSVGGSGTGTLTVQNGGAVSSSWGYLGISSGSEGTAIVDGIGSTSTHSGSLTVGGFGTGTLNIQNGGQVFNTEGLLGAGSCGCGTATVDGIGSKWTNSVSLSVGRSGTGTLTVQNGGQVSYATAYVGLYTGSNGTVTVDGAATVCSGTGSLYVGGSSTASGGTGSVTVKNGGQLTVGGMLKLWKADSLVSVSGGTVRAGTLAGTTGTIRITDPAGGTALTVASAASDTFSGTITDDTGPGSLVKVGGGTQTLGGANTYSGGTKVLEGTLLVTNTTGSGTGTGPVTVGAATLGGTGFINGPVTLTGDATLTSTGTLTIWNALTVQGLANQIAGGTIWTSGDVTIDPGAVFIINGTLGGETGDLIVHGTLMGKGTINKNCFIEAGGVLSPGSPSTIQGMAQILNAQSPRNFSFEIGAANPNYASPSNSLNDLIRLTDAAAPFADAAGGAPAAFTADTLIDVYFLWSDPTAGEYKAQFFAATDFTDAIADATYQYWRLDPHGSRFHNGNFFSPLDDSLVDWLVVPEMATFGGAPASGYITEFTVAPEPATLAMLAAGMLVVFVSRYPFTPFGSRFKERPFCVDILGVGANENPSDRSGA